MTKEKQNILMPLISTMLIFTLVNIWATYFMLKQNQYDFNWWKENYEKLSYYNKVQYNQMFGEYKTLEEFKKALDERVKNAWGTVWDDNAAAQPQEKWKVSLEELKVTTPVYWKAWTKFSIYEFSDLECPYCQQLHQTGIVKDAVSKNWETLNYVFKNFPLTQIHAWAQMKSEAGLCVFELTWNNSESFYKYIDWVFAAGTRASKDDILKIAESIGVQKDKMEECINSGKNKATVEKDLNQWMQHFGVGWTPTLIVVNNETWDWAKVPQRTSDSIIATMDSLK